MGNSDEVDYGEELSLSSAAAGNHPQTAMEPVLGMFMRELVVCLSDWLSGHREDASAYSLFVALTQETLKRVDSPSAAQREFDAQDLAAAASRPEASDFDASKRWVIGRRLETFAAARRRSIEDHFRAAGHGACLRPTRRSPGGKHRAVWFLEPYQLPDDAVEALATDAPAISLDKAQAITVEYQFTPPGEVKAAWYFRPLIGTGSFVTRSWRGILWAAAFLVSVAYLMGTALLALGYTYLRRPMQTNDLATLLVLAALAWFVWRTSVRPMVWLLEDRIIPATELWVAWNETNAQLELTKDEHNRRRLQLVRYTAVCPICASTLELRYSQGPNARRLLGCCTEAPHDHVFSFDRISRLGSRMTFGSLG